MSGTKTGVRESVGSIPMQNMDSGFLRIEHIIENILLIILKFKLFWNLFSSLILYSALLL